MNYTIDLIKQIIVSSLLGETYIEIGTRTITCRLKITQSTKYKDYFLMLFVIFNSFCYSSFKLYSYVNKQTNQ